MAVTGFWPVFKNLRATLDYADNPDKTTAPEYLDEDLYAALRYVENDNKTDRQVFVGGINCSRQNAYAEMIAVQRRFGLRGKVVGYHGIQSFKEGEVTVKRYIRLTYLIPEFLEKMDKGEIALSVGVELSFLDESSQREVLEQCVINDCTPSYSQAWRMHKADREGALTKVTIQTIMSEEKANQKARLKIPMERIRKYFPQGYTAAQIEDAVVKLCERDYRRRTDRER